MSNQAQSVVNAVGQVMRRFLLLLLEIIIFLLLPLKIVDACLSKYLVESIQRDRISRVLHRSVGQG